MDDRLEGLIVSDATDRAPEWMPIEPIRTAYIRCGRLPESGRSRNHRDGGYEAGVSVYRVYVESDVLVIDADGADLVSASFVTAGDRPWYWVTGREIGRGSDGEPLLADAVLGDRIPDADCQHCFAIALRDQEAI